MHWILPCVLFLTVNCSTIGNTANKSFEEDSVVFDILQEIQETCLPIDHKKTVHDIKKETQLILRNMALYKDIVKLNKELKNDILWILGESSGHVLISRILSWLKRDAKGICAKKMAQDCTELRKYTHNSGIYKIHPKTSKVEVNCDMTTDHGGWTIIQKRFDGSVNFQRGRMDYENGFGNLNGEYWLGNKHIHSLTSRGKYELRLDFTDMSNTKKYAVYKTFTLGDAASKYKLTVGNYSGDAGDSLTYHNGMKFSTYDQDNDEFGESCVKDHGPWWHKSCCWSALNRKFSKQLYWMSVSSSNTCKTSVMMIRKLNY